MGTRDKAGTRGGGMASLSITPAADGEAPAPAVRDVTAVRDEHALGLYCQGMRVREIATAIGASESTVRRWLERALRTLASDEMIERAAHLLVAIESQRAIARAAWDAYSREREVEQALLHGELDRVRRRKVRTRGTRRGSSDKPAREGGAAGIPRTAAGAASECAATVSEEYERPRHISQGARYLAVALAAQREVARLQGLYTRLGHEQQSVSITITRRPEGPENVTPGTAPQPDAEA